MISYHRKYHIIKQNNQAETTYNLKRVFTYIWKGEIEMQKGDFMKGKI
jgi:hypothetical protein